LWEIISSWMKVKCNAHQGMMGEGSNDSVRPEFDLAREYLEVLYRQFIVYLAFSIFPLVAVLGLICNIFEYKLDKYRLLRICQHPRGLQGSMRKFLVFFLFTIAVVALVGPPFGAVWVLTGSAKTMCTGGT
jgi:nitrate reductase NapE component